MMEEIDPRAEARAVLQEQGIGAAPVKVDRIARSLGIRLQFAPFGTELSGMAHIKNGICIIGVNSLHHPNRQRFTIAHEIGHFRMHRPLLKSKVHIDRAVLRRDSRSSRGDQVIEIQANRFASELLVPENLLSAMLGDRIVDIEDQETVAAIAKRFRVSEAVAKYRLLALD
jgi:Zn-dependent peptidase ImmA (M78 family)